MKGITLAVLFLISMAVTMGSAQATTVCYHASGLLYPEDGSVTWSATVKFDLASQADLMVTLDEFLAFDVQTIGDSVGLVGASYDLSEINSSSSGFLFAGADLGAEVVGSISLIYASFQDTTTGQYIHFQNSLAIETIGPTRASSAEITWEYVPCDEVPEPTTMALLGAGAAGLLAKRRRVV